MEEEQGFTSGGREHFPNLYSDYQRVDEFASWPQDALERLYEEYLKFLSRDRIMPRAKQTADKILLHVMFELTWREQDERG